MPIITLPDGNNLDFPKKVTGLEIAEKISKSLAKQALIMSVNGELKDLYFSIDKDCSVKIFTAKDPEGLEVIRHDAAHIMAMAVQELYPGTQVTIGPVIENGFYYDFARKEPFTDDDLKKIEERMSKIIDKDLKTRREVWERDKAIKHFKKIGEKYKAEIIESIPETEELSVYHHGDTWYDLCRGPHLVSSSKIGKAFKLTKVSGAYWRGDSKNEMLQRIYGTSWASQKDLDDYLKRIEEAEKRDHRKLGKEMDLFHFREESPGSVFWHEKGWTLFQKLINYMRAKQDLAGYKEVNTPEVLDRLLWEKSGHWEKFREDMFTTASENRTYAIKPMNCPCHIQVFNQGLKSYKDLPIRLAEFGSCHRNEPSGALHGLMRVRNFTQDDAHIFCTEDQMQDEVSSFIDLVFEVYKTFGFDEIIIKLSTRPEKRVGSEEIWDKSEEALTMALNNKNLLWELQPGEGAFYGPKIEFSLKDCLNRVWQCGTIQIDFSMPLRLDATYVDINNEKRSPVMLHRAILGSFERFIGILIEQYEAKFPIWLAPYQITILSITDRNIKKCQEFNQFLKIKGYRSKVDIRNEKIGYKIREATISRIPLIAVIGDKEQKVDSLALRAVDGTNLGIFNLNDLCQFMDELIKKKGRLE